MKIKPILYSSLLALLVLLAGFGELGHAQSEAQSAEEFSVQNIKKPNRSRKIPEGSKVKVYTHSGEKIKGYLTKTDENGITLNETFVPYGDIENMRVKGMGKLGAKIAGVVLGIIGIAGVGTGFLFWLAGRDVEHNQSGCGAIILVIFLYFLAICLAAAGFIFLLAALVSLLVGFLGGKAFKKSKWKYLHNKPGSPATESGGEGN
ncbi:MAG: hypothetical protein H6581_30270 [Bacteroidia bacterium]|nr:hypothetical protein [Bacteroidia bacterium]